LQQWHAIERPYCATLLPRQQTALTDPARPTWCVRKKTAAVPLPTALRRLRVESAPRQIAIRLPAIARKLLATVPPQRPSAPSSSSPTRRL
jgi:hypothetical protein